MYRSKMMIVMRRDLKMRKGKIAAQAGHACIDAIIMALNKEGHVNDFEITDDGIILKDSDKSTTPLSDWFKYGCAKICVYVDSEEELINIADKAKEKGIDNCICGSLMKYTHQRMRHNSFFAKRANVWLMQGSIEVII